MMSFNDYVKWYFDDPDLDASDLSDEDWEMVAELYDEEYGH